MWLNIQKNKQCNKKKWAEDIFEKQIFLQRRHTDAQQTQEKMHNITNYQRNANQNYNGISSFTSQTGNHQKLYSKCWRGCGERELSYTAGGKVNWYSMEVP